MKKTVARAKKQKKRNKARNVSVERWLQIFQGRDKINDLWRRAGVNLNL